MGGDIHLSIMFFKMHTCLHAVLCFDNDDNDNDSTKARRGTASSETHGGRRHAAKNSVF